MPKKPISADALIHMFGEELRPLYIGVRPPAVAIVPVPKEGWAALTSHRDRRSKPQLQMQIANIEKKLRQRYWLDES
jgi:hypothetical protein